MPDEKPQTSQKDQQHDHRAHIPVPAGSRQRRKFSRGSPHQIKSPIAECGDGVKKGEIYPFQQPEPRHKGKAEKQGPHQLHGQCSHGDELRHPHDAPDLGSRYRILHQGPLAQGDLFLGEHHDQNGHRHKPDSPHLNQRQNHQLAEERPVGISVVPHQPRDAGGGCGRKKAVRYRRAPRPCRSAWQGQQQGPYQNDGQITAQNQLHGGGALQQAQFQFQFSEHKCLPIPSARPTASPPACSTPKAASPAAPDLPGPPVHALPARKLIRRVRLKQ